MVKRNSFPVIILLTAVMACGVYAGDPEADPGMSNAASRSAAPLAASSLSDGIQIQSVGSFGSIEYLYGVGSYGIYLIQIDHPAGEVSSAKLFSTPLRFYGAAGSNDANYFWATTPGGVTGAGSALYKIYPREKATVKVSDDYGQDPHHAGDPDYTVPMKELAYDDDADVLYGTDYLGLYSIDTTTGQASFIGDFGNGPDGEPIDQTFSMGYDSQTQKLIIVNQKWLPNWVRSATHLYTVDPATAAVTFVADTTSLGMTDLYESHTSSSFFGTSNNPHEILDVDSTSGIAGSAGLIGHNILGLGGDFVEVVGPLAAFSGSNKNLEVTAYSELDAVRDETEASSTVSSGFDPETATTTAFVEEAGQTGLGQITTMTATGEVTTSGDPRMVLVDIEFDSVYDGPNDHGAGGGTATMTWAGRMANYDTGGFSSGDRVLVLIEGDHLLNDQISQYVLDWELVVHDGDKEHPAMVLTEEDVPDLASTPFLGAFQAVVGPVYAYDIELTLTLDIDMLAGDISADGKVNLLDFEMLALQWDVSPCDAGNLWCNGADTDQDGEVGLSDLTDLAADWLKGNLWDDDNQFDLDLDFAFKAIVMPESEVVLNNACADAIEMVANEEYYGSTDSLTTPSADISSCGANDVYDVWYRFIPDSEQTGVYGIDIETMGYFPVVVSVYDGCGGNELHCWDSSTSDRYFTADNSPGTEYLIRIAGEGGAVKGDYKVAMKYYPPPANDDCSGAVAVELGEYYQGSTLGATGTDPTSCGSSADAGIWYSYTADDDSAAAFIVRDWEGMEPFYTVSVYDSCDPGTQTELDCGTYEGSGESQPMSIAVLSSPTVGETYYIRVARNDSSAGSFDLDVIPGPENDDCADAIELYDWDTQGGSTIGATGTDMTSCGTDDAMDVWYSFTATDDMNMMFEVWDNDYTGMSYTVSIFDDCSGTSQIACAESSEGGEGEGDTIAKATCTLIMGQTVYIRIAFADNASGNFEINATSFYPPDNDECEASEEFYDFTSGSTLGATGTDESYCGDNDTHDVWYTYTAPGTGTHYFMIYTDNGLTNCTLTIYDGVGCGASLPTIVDCGDTDYGYLDMGFELVGSQTYLVRVSSNDSGQGAFSMEVYSEGGGGD